MKYNGIELTRLNTFDNVANEQRVLLVWNDGDKEPQIKLVIAMAPGIKPWIASRWGDNDCLTYTTWDYAAEIPEELIMTNLQFSEYCKHNDVLCEYDGRISTEFTFDTDKSFQTVSPLVIVYDMKNMKSITPTVRLFNNWKNKNKEK